MVSEHHTADRPANGKGDFKRISFFAVCHRANQSQTGDLIVGFRGKDHRRPATTLLMASLRIKIKPDEIALAGNVNGFFHQISLPLGLPQSVSA